MSDNQQPIATLESAIAQGLNPEEFDRISQILGRTPNITELAIFAVMWSEHCSYKNSILELKTLPRSGTRLLVSAGEENAGLVDIGDGWAVAFKIESHNHPSAVEPFQGAATGVGGILRDIFTMGARPLVVLDSLRFGNLTDLRTRYLFDGVIRGIAHYGNCFGVPTAAGEVMFDPAYTGNPLVNVMAVGVVRRDGVARAKAKGIGNPVFYVGSRTGRDGIHGATFASDELSADNESKRPSVQVGDPFAEKLLLEATLELAQTDALVAIQDMGAAGLTCSSSEMSAGGKVGMTIDLDKIPLRESDMEPWEIMLSESQERMLLVADKGKEAVVKKIFDKWDLQAVEVGSVTADGRLAIFHKGIKVADVPAYDLVLGGGAPQYKRESHRPEELDRLENFDLSTLPEPDDYGKILLELLAHPDIASKRWVYEQYDVSVRTNTALEPGRGDAAVIRVEGTGKGLAVKTDGNGRKVRLNPHVGAAQAVVEAARNVACVGAHPVAVTNCLNFGHPYKPEVYYFFRESVAGMGEACRALSTPVTGGNVSFYNETEGEPVHPTPVIGMLGVLDDVKDFVPGYFRRFGDGIFLVGQPVGNGLGGSTYLSLIFNLNSGRLDAPDYPAELRLYDFLVQSARRRIIESAHDISDGGLAVAIAESCIINAEHILQGNGHKWSGMIGAEIRMPMKQPLSAHLFGEPPGLVIVSVQPDRITEFKKLASSIGVPVTNIGITGGDKIVWNDFINIPLKELADRYFLSLPKLLAQT